MKVYDFKGSKNACGSNVRRIRKAKNLSQSQLAAMVQMEELMLQRDSISRIELGTRFVADYELNVLAHVLGVSMEELVDMPENE